MKDKETPLVKQYNRIKSKYPDTVLLFRLGDFFETFDDDAKITSQVCGITLTKRNNGAAGEMPLAGFPHHQLDNYLPKLVRAGYRVAVCEQLEDPKKAKGIVKRDVIEVVTPGAALYDKLLDSKRNNYLAAVFIRKVQMNEIVGFACTDISTGEFLVSEFDISRLIAILESFNPAEIIISKSQKEEVLKILEKLSTKPHISKLESWIFDDEFSREALINHFKTVSLKGFGIEHSNTAIAAAGSIFHYLKETRQGELSQIQNISWHNPTQFMELDHSTRRNLEISYSMNSDGKDSSLIAILDKTQTPMGGRLFRKWISRPLLDLSDIHNRLDLVTYLLQSGKYDKLKSILSEIGDIERLITKINNNRANPRDVVALKSSLSVIPKINELLLDENPVIQMMLSNLVDVNDLVEKIAGTIIDEPGQIGSGNIFRTGINPELDSYVEAKYYAKIWLRDFQEQERIKTGISTLKVGYTTVFGYYIEISHAHKTKIPEDYKRKQTLTNAERYITNELKEFESRILNAEEKIQSLEGEVFGQLLQEITIRTANLQQNAYIIAQLDCLNSYALAANENNYTRPEIDNSNVIEIFEGRHPVVEKLLPIGEKYQTNNTGLDIYGEMIHIITGPNMAGKSCYLRQVALIVYMGQIGSYVPAASAHFGLTDRIFTRVGAQDNISAGESTFLVEMQEAANILNNATNRSLILLDEVGRGTATFDGISIAWSIAEYIHDIINAKTLFATHYHELNELAARYEHISNYKIDVIDTEGKLIFTHKVSQGGTDHSFGIHVAQMAGLPIGVITRANELMKNLENSSTTDESEIKSAVAVQHPHKNKRVPEQLAIFEIRDDGIRDKIKSVDINNISPIQALQLLSELSNDIRKDSHR
jgi:DNA mismatch repair protein MutS